MAKPKKTDVLLDKNLQKLLQRTNLSINSFSKQMNLNKSAMHNYLNGVLPQGLPALIKIANFFEISLDELVFGIQKKELQNTPLTPFPQEGRYEVTVKKI